MSICPYMPDVMLETLNANIGLKCRRIRIGRCRENVTKERNRRMLRMFDPVVPRTVTAA